MEAFAVLDGGGVKGAALAGCLAAAEDYGIKFVGYGGTSAGSIVALLACVGYSGEDLRRIMVDEIAFKDFLDDGGEALGSLQAFASRCKGKISTALAVVSHGNLLQRLGSDLGLYNAPKLSEFLLAKIKPKLPGRETSSEVTFEDLKQGGHPLLKILVSDLGNRAPAVYSGSGGQDRNGSVIDAVRASVSYPFVFRPVKMNNRFLVDGGLSCNLPIFLFERERREKDLPVIAFDLLTSPTDQGSTYGLRNFCADMLATTLESSEHLLRSVVGENIYAIAVPIPKGINTLDFGISKDRRQELYTAGHSAALKFFTTQCAHWKQARNPVEQLQAVYQSPDLVIPVLRAVALDFVQYTKAQAVRTNIMLRTNQNTLRIVYQFGMDTDPDLDMELAIDGGCAGRAFSARTLALADLEIARSNFPDWNMSAPQQNRVRPDRKALFSIPLFRPRKSSAKAKISEFPVIGVLNIDSASPLRDTGWVHSGASVHPSVSDLGKLWADIVSMVLTHD